MSAQHEPIEKSAQHEPIWRSAQRIVGRAGSPIVGLYPRLSLGASFAVSMRE